VFCSILHRFLFSILAMQLVTLTLCWELCKETFENYPETLLSLCKVHGKTPLKKYANTVWVPRRICDIKNGKKLKKAAVTIRDLSGL